MQHTADDKLRIQLPYSHEVQYEGRVTLEANIEKLQVTFEAHILNITQPLILGAEFLECFGVMLNYAKGSATVRMRGCRYPLCLR